MWGDVYYARGGDEFQAEEAIWHLREGGNRITVTSGEGTVGVGREGDESVEEEKPGEVTGGT
jgi:hypothetical protein